jgi:hypothetical protein
MDPFLLTITSQEHAHTCWRFLVFNSSIFFVDYLTVSLQRDTRFLFYIHYTVVKNPSCLFPMFRSPLPETSDYVERITTTSRLSSAPGMPLLFHSHRHFAYHLGKSILSSMRHRKPLLVDIIYKLPPRLQIARYERTYNAHFAFPRYIYPDLATYTLGLVMFFALLQLCNNG